MGEAMDKCGEASEEEEEKCPVDKQTENEAEGCSDVQIDLDAHIARLKLANRGGLSRRESLSRNESLSGRENRSRKGSLVSVMSVSFSDQCREDVLDEDCSSKDE